jgi:hypothetical protein
MKYTDFLRLFAPVLQVYGEHHFPDIVLERIHFKIKDLPPDQVKELLNLILDTCEYAPKIPKIIELANIVRARHREGVREITSPDNDTRTDEVAQKALEQIRHIFSKSKTGAT